MMPHYPTKLAVPVGPTDHIVGPETASVTLVEYGDYECPYCGRAQVIVGVVRRRLGRRLRFVFRNFPLVKLHRNAQSAAEAAEAAGAQGRFWEMHDMLYKHQHALDDAHLYVYATAVGLDTAAFESALASRSFAHRIREDVLGGRRSGVARTPTFFIETSRYEGPQDVDALVAILEDAADAKERGKQHELGW